MHDIRGILFDKDGTLVDFEATWFTIADQLALRAGAGDRAVADRLLEAGGYDFAQRAFRPDSIIAAGTNADIVSLWYPDLAPHERMAEIEAFDRFTTEHGASRPVAVAGCEEAIRALHAMGFSLAVATNDSTAGAERTISALGIAQMFVAAYGYDSVAAPKPAPDIVAAFCDLTGLKPSQVAMVGDNSHDMEMARAGRCGLAVAVLSGTGTRERLAPMADVVLASIADLPGYLSRG
jgi:phosphoglycolate phosphatase